MWYLTTSTQKRENFAFTFIIIQLLESPIPAAASSDKNTDDDQLMAKLPSHKRIRKIKSKTNIKKGIFFNQLLLTTKINK